MLNSKWKAGLLGLLCGVSVLSPVAFAGKASNRVEFVGSLFTGATQDENFNRIDQLFPTADVPASSQPQPWPNGSKIQLPAHFRSNGKPLRTRDFLRDTDTAALLVLKDGKVRFERYWLTGSPDAHWLSMSVAKSFVSAMIGIAVDEGKIGSVEDPVTKYLPNLAGSGYDGVRIKDILQMSSGVRWNEDYSDRNSDIARLGTTLATGGSFADFPAQLPREFAPGTFNRYNSTDTLVLGLLLEKATGVRIASYMREKLWGPLGATDRAYWLTDDSGTAMAFGGLNATARDYARLGELYRLNGVWHGRQVVPSDWVKSSITPDAPHLMPGVRANSDSDMGYGYQWWVPGGGDDQDFCAIGVYNQNIYVNPREHVVIVKLSASRNYGRTNDDSSWREHDHMGLFRAIARSVH